MSIRPSRASIAQASRPRSRRTATTRTPTMSDEPAHQAMTLAPLGRHRRPMSSSSSITDARRVTLRSRLSGLRMIRCPRTAGASRLMSSGVMNDCPRIAAIACDDRYSASEARGLPPSRMSGCSRRLPDQLDDVPAELVVHADRPHGLLALDDLLGRDHGLEVVDRVLVLEPRRASRPLLPATGYPRLSRTRNRSSCASGSGKVPSWSTGFWVAMTRNGGFRSYVVPSTETSPLGHRLQQGRLGPRRGPVDLVGQEDLREDRAGPERRTRSSSD